MKKQLLLWVLLMLPLMASFGAVGTIIDGINYILTPVNMTATVHTPTDGLVYSGDMVIPQTVTTGGKTYTVTSIGYGAFRNCSGLTAITIPESVTTIANYAFNGCSGLTAITIPESVHGIGSYAFKDCTGLTAITIPEGVKYIYSDTFNGCTSLTTVKLPESVKAIGEWAFCNCKKLTTLNLPDGLEGIGKNAFYGCVALTIQKLPANLTTVEGNAFYQCHLGAVTIPAGMTRIEDAAFRGCYLSEMVIPNSVVYLGKIAFAGSSLTSVTIGNGVTKINDNTFNDCKQLVSVKMSEMVDSIGSRAFEKCSSLKEIKLPNSLTTIGDYAFLLCGLTSLTLPEGVKTIGAYAFEGYTASVTIPASVASIGEAAFSDCSDITVASGNKTYDSRDNCHAIIETATNTMIQGCKISTFPASVTAIGNNAFSRCKGLTTLNLPSTVKTIGKGAFNGCSELTSLTLNEGLQRIEQQAFDWCGKLEKVTIPNSVKTIGSGAFEVTRLRYLTIGEGVTSIDAHAFPGSLVSVVCRAVNVPETDEKAFWNNQKNIFLLVPQASVDAYKACKPWSEFKSIQAIESGPVPVKEDIIIGGITYHVNTGDKTAVVKTADSKQLKGDLVIPATVEHDGVACHVTDIGSYAFSHCTDLTSVTIPEGMKTIGESAFWECTGLATLTLPEGVTTIGLSAFSGCPVSVTIPASVTSIGNQAFTGCSDITVASGNKTYDSRDNCHALIETATNTLIQGCNNSTIPEGVTAIGNSAFSGCKGLTTVTIPGSVKTIGEQAFYSVGIGIEKLTIVTIGEGVTSIGTSAFEISQSTNVICLAKEVPAAQHAFSGSYRSATLYVLPEALEAYKAAAPWNEFKAIGAYEGGNLPLNTEAVIGGINYYIQTGTKTAEVRQLPNNNKYTGDIIIPSTVIYDGVTCSVTDIGANAFAWCNQLTTVTIPGTVKTIGGYAFNGCSGLTALTLNEGLQRIEQQAFNSCQKLEKVIIPEGVTSIGERAFNGCPASVTIPEGVTSIGEAAFNGCSDITVASGNKTYDSRDNCHALIETATNTMVQGCKISTFPASVTAIGNSAFSGCKGLTTVTIPGTVKTIGKSAFSRCSELTALTLNEGLQRIEQQAFYLCQKLEKVIIPEGMKTISESAFLDCKCLTTLTLPEGVTTIGRSAFSGCPVSVTIPASVASIGEAAFTGCSDITVASGNKTYDSRDNCHAIIETATNTMIQGCKISTFPASVTAIGNNAFSGCKGLTTLTIPGTVKTIGDWAFSSTGIKSLTIGEGVTSIGTSTFPNNIENVVCLAKEVPAANKWSFRNQQNTYLYVLPEALEAYKATAPWSEFKAIIAIENGRIPVTTDTVIGGINYHINTGIKTAEVRPLPDNQKYTGEIVIPATVEYDGVPYHVTTIGNNAFSGCTGLTSVTIPGTVTAIGNSAFSGCKGLTTLTIPGTVTAIGDWAFSDCTGLTTLTIPGTVKTIGDWAFSSTGIKSLTIGEGVTSIGTSAFPNNIENVVCLAKEVPAANKRSFSNQQNTYLYVLPEALEAYKATAPWNEFKAIKTIDEYTAVGTVRAAGFSIRDVYGLDGKRTDVLQKGLNIIRRNDGKTIKVIVR